MIRVCNNLSSGTRQVKRMKNQIILSIWEQETKYDSLNRRLVTYAQVNKSNYHTIMTTKKSHKVHLPNYRTFHIDPHLSVLIG